MEYSVVEAVEAAESLGTRCALSTFWKYTSLGLLKKGRKKRGRGNVLHVDYDTPQRIRLVKVLNESLGIPLNEISEFLAAYAVNYVEVLPLRPLSRRDKKIVRNEYRALKKQALRQLLERLPGLLSSQVDSKARKVQPIEKALTNAGLREPRDFDFGETPGDECANSPREPRDVL